MCIFTFIGNVVANKEGYYGKYIGKLSQLHHGVSGDVFAVDARTLHLRNFNYDGEGPGRNFRIKLIQICFVVTLVRRHFVIIMTKFRVSNGRKVANFVRFSYSMIEFVYFPAILPCTKYSFKIIFHPITFGSLEPRKCVCHKFPAQQEG